MLVIQSLSRTGQDLETAMITFVGLGSSQTVEYRYTGLQCPTKTRTASMIIPSF